MVNSDVFVDLNIVIINWNSGDHLGRLLGSISGLEERAGSIRVVDNGSVDSSLEPALSMPGVIVDEMPRNLGFAGAANRGIEASQAEFILLLNPDILIQPDSIWVLYQEMIERPQVGLACGPLFDHEGQSQGYFQLRPFPSLARVLSDALFVDEFLRLLKLRIKDRSPFDQRGKALNDPRIIVEQPAAAYWLLRKRAWESVGGFDERFYPAWFEDVDFCRRLRENQWQMLFVPKANASHRGGIALEQMGYRRFIEIYYGNLLKYWRKHHSSSRALVVPAVRFGMLMRKTFIRR